MNPEQLQEPYSPVYSEPLPQNTTVSNKGRVKLALWLMIGPSALIPLVIIIYALINFILSSSLGDLDQSNAIVVIINIVLYLAGAISIIAWLPCMIIGIILLATKK